MQTVEAESEELVLWAAYQGGRAIAARNALFSFYTPWIRSVATACVSGYSRDSVEVCEVLQIASVALIESIERFDPLHQVPFKGFAVARVRGSVLNHLAEQRLNRKRVAYVDVRELEERGSRIDRFVDSVLDLAFAALLQESSSQSRRQEMDPLLGCVAEREQTALRKAVASLTQPARLVIEAHYFEQLSCAQIADVLSLSKARISQIHKGALRELRRHYERLT